MKTKFIISKGWELLKEYDFIIPASKGDVFNIFGIEYQIESVIIDADDNSITYLLKR